MHRMKVSVPGASGLCVVIALSAGLVAGCGYMPRTGNQISTQLDARDQALREEMTANKQDLLTRIQEADARLGEVDGNIADLQRAMGAVSDLDIRLQSVCADMTAVREDVRRVQEGLRASARKEVADALMDAGRQLQSSAP